MGLYAGLHACVNLWLSIYHVLFLFNNCPILPAFKAMLRFLWDKGGKLEEKGFLLDKIGYQKGKRVVLL